MQKTRKDLSIALVEAIGEQTNNPLMRVQFEQDLLPLLLQQDPSLNDPISDSEYEHQKAAYRRDAPAMARFLKQRKITNPPVFNPRN